MIDKNLPYIASTELSSVTLSPVTGRFIRLRYTRKTFATEFI